MTTTLLRGLPVAALLLGAACSNGSTNDNADAGPVGGPVTGAADTHCGARIQPTNPNVCHLAGAADAGTDDTADAGDDAEDEAATLFNAEGDDDDCKYHVTFTNTPVRQNTDVTFTVTVVKKDGNTAATGADPFLEVFLDDTHPAPNSNTTAIESPPGTYAIGPVRFDAPGRWTVRYHFYGDCDDSEESPHSHVAFFIDVP